MDAGFIDQDIIRRYRKLELDRRFVDGSKGWIWEEMDMVMIMTAAATGINGQLEDNLILFAKEVNDDGPPDYFYGKPLHEDENKFKLFEKIISLYTRSHGDIDRFLYKIANNVDLRRERYSSI